MDEIFEHRETTVSSFLSDSLIVNIDSMNMKQEKTERKIKKWTTFNSLGDTILAKEKKCKKKNMSYKRELKMKKELESIRTRSLDP